MTIKREIINELKKHPYVDDHETGGILGGNDDCIMYVVYDDGIKTHRRCAYYPNVKHINEAIERWEELGIDFYGLFHTHKGGIELSEEDICYINRIVKLMPPRVKRLMFPVINVYDQNIAFYLANRIDEYVDICEFSIEIVD